MSEVVEVRIEICAKPATVFRFLVDPSWFRRWMGGASSMDDSPECRFRVGYPDGGQAEGRILEQVKNSKVVYSWGYTDGRFGMPPDSTRVIVELQESRNGTSLLLRHEGLPTTQDRLNHLQGWSFYTAQLAAGAAHEQFLPAIPTVVQSYIAAWNASDVSRRTALLEAAVESDVVYRDRMAVVCGRVPLLHHIGGTQQYAPGLTLQGIRGPRQSHNCVAFDWSIMEPNGGLFATGSCFGELSVDGRFRSIVGFWNEQGQ